MINPTQIFQVMKSASSMGAGSQSELSAPFMQGLSSMNMSASEGAASVISNVSNTCGSMLSKLNSMTNGIQSDVAVKQATQAAARPEDFDVTKQDLRPTVATGFPSELASFFSNLPKF